jgi:hypothetical protein
MRFNLQSKKEDRGSRGAVEELKAKVRAEERVSRTPNPPKKHIIKKPIDIRPLTKKVRVDFQRDREYEANKKIIAFENRQQKYGKSSASKVSGKIGRGFSFIKNPAQVLYQRQGQIRPRMARDPYSKAGGYGGESRSYNTGYRQTAPGVQSGRVGRPYGTVKYTDPRTGQPIGVYEYRKILSAQLRNERYQVQAQSQLSPQQQVALQRIRQQQAYNQSNVEGRAVPNTYGNMQSIHDEADSYAHLVD